MAARSSKLAGLTYTRGLQEAPGHIAGQRLNIDAFARKLNYSLCWIETSCGGITCLIRLPLAP
ncbi:hypothetical protein BKA56DRAFT_600735 [Ilyonectria sp. MPI-CAGE-AT-0026]|nr:hypothetical protein BKA56DRAFT_600735 [Ilyonectria sp. MPI-CAGE-AT-0026]